MSSTQIYDPHSWSKRKNILVGLIAATAIIVTSIVGTSILEDSDISTQISSLFTEEISSFDPVAVSSSDGSNGVWYSNIEHFLRDARELAIEGKFSQALPLLDNAIYESLKNGTPDAQALYEKGKTLHQMGRYEQALVYYNEAEELEPENKSILRSKANALAQIGQLAEAKFYFEKAVAAN